MLGNLVENAAQWARTSVRLCGWHDSDATGLLVEDDGPGVPDHEVETVLARGGRLDATKPGAGLGLAIVGDLVETYGGSLVLRPIAARRLEGRAPAPRPPRQGKPGDAGTGLQPVSSYRARFRPVIIAFTRFSPCSMLAKTTPATCRAIRPSVT